MSAPTQNPQTTDYCPKNGHKYQVLGGGAKGCLTPSRGVGTVSICTLFKFQGISKFCDSISDLLLNVGLK